MPSALLSVPSQSVAVTFTVTNLGTVATTAGSWTDSIYLSLDTTIDAGAVLLGRILHTGDLAAFSQYTTTLTSPVPGIIPGSYHVIVVTDSGLQVPDFNRANGTDVAPTEIAIQPPTLLIDTPLTGTIANGQDLYYRLDVAPGTSVGWQPRLRRHLNRKCLSCRALCPPIAIWACHRAI